jgi:DNA-binding transcriptional LysR family regulator
MNIKALRAFRAVVAEGSVIGASRTMNLSQPAVSRLLALLEAELRLTLFLRVRRRLVLTDEGRVRIPTKSATYSDFKPATCSDLKPDGFGASRVVV